MSCIARITKLSVKISSKTWRLLGLCPNPPLISVHLEVSIKTVFMFQFCTVHVRIPGSAVAEPSNCC